VTELLIRAFSIQVSESVLADLRQRIRQTRWPDQLPDIGWAQGTELGYLHDLLTYWAEDFDWPAQERRLNQLRHFRVEIDGLGIHFVHQPARGAGAIPLILTHGWPSCFLELLPLVPLLTEPQSHGIEGPPFDLVIPSLPGYGFSDRPRRTGITVQYTAHLWDQLMRGLGYQRYAAGGGDFGSAVATCLGRDHSESVFGIHLSTLDMMPYLGPGSRPLSQAEQAYLEQNGRWWQAEGGYKAIQATKPQTAGYGLNDSPAGLAAWLLEKWRSWSDCGGDLESRFDRDFLLSTLTLYWASETITSSMRYYYDDRRFGPVGPGDFVGVPTAMAVFPHEYVAEGIPPRELVERLYNLHRWTVMPRGGHFASREEPRLLAQDIAAFFSEGDDFSKNRPAR
jgi:pimeloyl-ACP methyl ester carboxylesterase